MPSPDKIAASVLRPYFDAVRDVYVEWGLERMADVRFVITTEVHDKRRHFAATTEDGKRMLYAPQIVELPHDTLIAIIAHEFGHAADFAYPALWVTPDDGPGRATFLDALGEKFWDTKAGRTRVAEWQRRNRDQVEWSADSIAEAVTGKRIGYAGDCVLQTLRGGVDRPMGLR